MPAPANPYPFGQSQHDHRQCLATIPTRDLIAEIEAARWLAMDVDNDSRAVADIQLGELVSELERRQRLLAQHGDDPVAPSWPRRMPDLRARVDAVKAAWPLDQFCREILVCDLRRSGSGRMVARCPLPGHEETTPSFTVYPDEHAWCFGCGRGGDVIKLTGLFFGFPRFSDALELLEARSGIDGRRSA